jgi:hypothetical protein
MPFKFGNTTLTGVTYNGIPLTKVIYNGTTVFELATGEPSAVYYGFRNDDNAYKYNGSLSTLLATGLRTQLNELNSIRAMAIDGGGLFFVNSNNRRIYKVNKTDLITLIASSGSILVNYPTGSDAKLVMDSTGLYTHGTSGSRISVFNPSTLAVTQSGTISTLNVISDILIDDTYLYVFASSSGRAQRTLKSNINSGWTNSGSTNSSARVMVQNQNYLYVIRDTGRNIWRIDKNNFTASPVLYSVSTSSSTSNITSNNQAQIDENNIYFIRQNTGIRTLIRTNLTGGNVEESTYNFTIIARRIQLSATKIYVVCDDRTIVVFDKSNINSGTVFQVASPNASADTDNAFVLEF